MKILLTSASTGSGHTRAAQAVESALRLSFPGVEFVHINVLDYVIKPFRILYEDGYAFVAKRNPWMWGILYRLSNNGLANKFCLPPLNLFQRLNAGHFLRFVARYAPDKIISTHFLIPQLLSGSFLNRTFKLNLETVITDYGLHNYWVNPLVQKYYVAHEGVLEELKKAGVPSEKIVVSGIPVDPIFLKEVNNDRIRQLIGLKSTIPTLLVLSGGEGIGALEDTVQAMFALRSPLQIITVAGRNEGLKKKLNRLRPPNGITLINHGFVTNMHDLLSVSDLVVSKAGGLTVSEGLVKGTPMIFFGPLPGQEDKNVDYVKSRNAGDLALNLSDLVQKVGDLINNPTRLSEMKNNALQAAHPQASFTVAESLVRSPVISV